MSLDLEGALKNALERGASLEDAIRSLTNSGYPEQEVREAANIVSPSLPSMLNSSPKVDNSSQSKSKKRLFGGNPKQPLQKKFNPTPVSATDFVVKKEKTKGNYGLIIFLVFLLIFLLGAFVSSLLFKEQLVEFLRNFLGR